MTIVGTRAVVSNGKVENVLKKAKWVWRPKMNYQDHVYKYNGSYMLKKFKAIQRSLEALWLLEVIPKEFNLFFVSQICDKKNSVLFPESKCLILSPNFKLLNESQVVLRAPRKDGVYNLDLKNIVSSGGITCLYANATADKSKLWHRRLGHVNFKNINKLVKGHLVRGLPSKVFKNDHTCVACKKGKQHKASCKVKLERIIRKTLELLHMDLLGPVSIESIKKKRYCLVVTDDFNRFSWVFFLATKDETSEILCNSGSLQVNSGRLLANSMDFKLILMTVGDVHMANLKYPDKHNMVAFLKKPNKSVGLTEVVDFIKVRTLANETQQLVASIDSKEYNITAASVRSKLQLADATRIHNLSDAKIYAGLATLWYVTKGDIVPLLPAMLAGAAVDQGNTSGSAEDSVQLKDLMVLISKLVTRINSLEKELKDTKQTLGNVVLKLVKKGRKFQDIDDDPIVSFVRESMKEKLTDFFTSTKASGEAQEEEISPTILKAAKTLSKVDSQGVSKEKSTDKGKRYRRRARSMAKKIDTGLDAEEEINNGKEEINTGIEEVSTGSTKVDSGTASERGQREGKAPIVEEGIQDTHKTKEQMRQEEARLEEAIKLQAQLDDLKT
ncbi:putative ribonuclease H-like domain-containing protein [Tanacetum coccineum]